MDYKHTWTSGEDIPLPVGKAVCAGKNYKDHAEEMDSAVPEEPILFIKPSSSFISMEDPIEVIQDRGLFHYEAEISVLISEKLTQADERQVRKAIAGIGTGLDLTLRDVQSEAGKKGEPWEKAKAFDKSCPLSPFEPASSFEDLDDICLRLRINGDVRQKASSSEMIFRIVPLIVYITSWFTLNPGDVIMTGTPAGVGSLSPGDRLELELEGVFSTRITAKE